VDWIQASLPGGAFGYAHKVLFAFFEKELRLVPPSR
jgi:hypothetical protein